MGEMPPILIAFCWAPESCLKIPFVGVPTLAQWVKNLTAGAWVTVEAQV